MKKIIVLGASRYYSKSIESARKAGYYIIALDKNPYFNKFNIDSRYWGAHAFSITKLGANIFNSIEIFHAPTDDSLLNFAQRNIHTPQQFNAYIASHNFSSVDSIEYSGRSPNSEISQTGCRTSLKKGDLNCTNEMLPPIKIVLVSNFSQSTERSEQTTEDSKIAGLDCDFSNSSLLTNQSIANEVKIAGELGD